MPDSIGTMTSLRRLYACFNGLSTFPEVVSMDNLSWLDLANNNITEFPMSILMATNLSHLNLHGNNLKKGLPEEISALQKLQVLQFGYSTL